MPGQLIQFQEGDGASSRSLPALLPALAGGGPVRTIGNGVWKICRICSKGGDRLRSLWERTKQGLESVSGQLGHLRAGFGQETATAQTGRRRFTPAVPEPPLSLQPGSDRRRTDQTGGASDVSFFIEVELPPLSSARAATADIVIPVLLPDFLDSSEVSPAQFFEEHFRVYVESDSGVQSTALCLVDPTGHIWFSSEPDPAGTLPASPA